MRNKRGITLIALVVTIVVLLILAGVSIATLTGDNGIIGKANEAKIETTHAQVREAIQLAYVDYELEEKNPSANAFLEFLKNKSYISDEGIVNTQVLFGSKLSLGNGKDTNDVYKVEEEEGFYKLYYYGKTEEPKRELVAFNKNGFTSADNPYEDLEVTNPDYFEYSYDETTETATITGVKEQYGLMGYYSNIEGIIGIQDGEEIITDIVLPREVKIGEVTYTITKIGSSAFSTNSSYIKSQFTSFIIPDTIKEIGSSAFYNCSTMNNVMILKGVTSIGESAFSECSGLTSIEIPDSVTSIGESAFWYCSGLTSITIGNSVTSIGRCAFWGCSGLISIQIPNSVTSIEYSTFRFCGGLTSIEIPLSVRNIGEGAFYGCSKLTKVYYRGTAEEWGNISINSTDNSYLTNAEKEYEYTGT